FGEPDVERHVAAVLEAELLEPGLQAFNGRMARGVRGVDDADAERTLRLLRLRVRRGADKNSDGDHDQSPYESAPTAPGLAHDHGLAAIRSGRPRDRSS